MSGASAAGDPSEAPRVTAAVLAGGVGARMGGARPKQLLPLAGRAVIERSIAAFCDAPDVDDVIVLMVEDHLPEVSEMVEHGGLAKVSAVLPGGPTRTATSTAALRALDTRDGRDLVLLHDAVRPLVSQRVIADCVAALTEAGAVGTAVPTADTVIEVERDTSGSQTLRAVPPRESLRRMQTPQGFRLDVLRRAYDRALADPELAATDDCGVVLRYLPGETVRIVEGDESNLKITNPGDVEVAEMLLRRQPAARVP
ncbi:IspD/TarI family cytidylyltransferase [Halostreptopolyspora alba]|uniref:2-C-methyl-D-erythritol 4-phosphate cytidylyltransferase n=1 Tax=Halostreptopolyspora alba TaxID=2487137 RepID=A0A3N0E3F2_9ACTN|nr:2-C-methyl-D-erythritol 4-phosphate cytidylyltransferase [Nocardiopsaceae bacterium YIM 96095]